MLSSWKTELFLLLRRRLRMCSLFKKLGLFYGSWCELSREPTGSLTPRLSFLLPCGFPQGLRQHVWIRVLKPKPYMRLPGQDQADHRAGCLDSRRGSSSALISIWRSCLLLAHGPILSLKPAMAGQIPFLVVSLTSFCPSFLFGF